MDKILSLYKELSSRRPKESNRAFSSYFFPFLSLSLSLSLSLLAPLSCPQEMYEWAGRNRALLEQTDRQTRERNFRPPNKNSLWQQMYVHF